MSLLFGVTVSGITGGLISCIIWNDPPSVMHFFQCVVVGVNVWVTLYFLGRCIRCD